MLKKIKKIFFNIKALIILLIVLIVVGWGLTIYFGLKINSDKSLYSVYQNKVEKLGYYSALLKKSTELIRQNKNLDVLEDDVRLLENGALLAEWENAVFSGKKEDAEHYLDVIIDSLIFFSK
jgi:flagellar basal body-associated protein FliL